MACASAAPTWTPWSLPLRSPVACTLVAPWAPTAAAISLPSPPVNTSTTSAISRALASISRLIGATAPSDTSAWTHTLERAMSAFLSNPWDRSEDLEAVEELDDLQVGFAVVLDYLAGLAL